MRLVFIVTLVFALWSGAYADPAGPPRADHILGRIIADRTVIGSVADISQRYEGDAPVTFLHILEFATDVFPQEPHLLQVRLCGDLAATLEPYVHTNITLVYKLASPSRVTGCLSLTHIESWQDNDPEQNLFSRSLPKRNTQLERNIHGIIHHITN
jgi:hypothetical protein